MWRRKVASLIMAVANENNGLIGMENINGENDGGVMPASSGE
jgi:hypothetical protein